MESGDHDDTDSFSRSLTPETADVMVIDIAGINDPAQRPMITNKIGKACREKGLFQVINHGIPQNVLDEALRTAFEFFNLPMAEKERYMSDDVHKPVRYVTTIKDGVEKSPFWRNFLKHYAYPIDEWIQQWPDNPSDYREKMADYAVKARNLAIQIMGAITESLGLGPKYIEKNMEDGMQVMAVNCYPPCPNQHATFGQAPHSDHSCITILLYSSSGLEIVDTSDNTWRSAPGLHGALQILVGDHLEVLSNGIYKSVMHRVRVNNERTRISVANFHSLGLDEKMSPAKELISDQQPTNYKESSFQDFLDFLTKNEGKRFIESLKISSM